MTNRSDQVKVLDDSSGRGNFNSNQLQSRPGLELNLGSEYSSEMMESIMSPSKGMRNKWSYEELAQIETHG